MNTPVSASIWSKPGVVLFVGLLGAILGAVLSPIVTQYLSDQKQPELRTEDRPPNLTGLDQSTLKQISLVPSTYFVRHWTGGQADNVAVRLEADRPLNPNSVAVDAGAEPFTIKSIDSQHVQVDLPHMRPGTSLAITVTHGPSTEINWKTISSNAAINADSDNSRDWEYAAIALAIIGTLVASALAVAFFVGSWVRNRVAAQSGDGDTLAFWTAFAIVFNVGLNAFGSFVNVTSISLADVFYGLLVFLIVTNWTTINNVIKKASR